MSTIQKESIQSLYIELRFNETVLSTGTAFIAMAKSGTPVLITNRHNFTGRHQFTGRPLSPNAGIPDRVRIHHHARGVQGQTGVWKACDQQLLKDDAPLWIEHPTLREKADFVALPLSHLDEISLYPYDMQPPENEIWIGPAQVVSVIGFPYGETAGQFLGIWVTGTIASEPTQSYEGLPVMLLDCRTRQGQSGSPVIAYRAGGAIQLANGSTVMGVGVVSNFLGIYSGRLSEDSDIGMVWKATAIRELLESI